MFERLFEGPFGLAVAGGARAGSVGEAFLVGYRAALRRLVPSLDREACLCASEEGGAHPRAIQTTLREGRLNGRKKWVTGAGLAEVLLVVASVGPSADEEGGRNRLKLARVDARAPGVTLTPMPPTPFVPEIPHAEVSFHEVTVDEVLEGDGYERYLKPFRTVEDAHVFGAVLAYLFAASQHERAFKERILALLGSLAFVAAGDPSSRERHLVLAGALTLGQKLAEEAPEHLDEPARAQWLRDSALLQVAAKARQARADAAWSALE